MTRKILGCILAMAMLFACGSFSLAEGEGTPTIKMTAVLHPNTQNPAELPIYQQISEKTGVNVEWTCYTSNDWAEEEEPDVRIGRSAGRVFLLLMGWALPIYRPTPNILWLWRT